MLARQPTTLSLSGEISTVESAVMNDSRPAERPDNADEQAHRALLGKVGALLDDVPAMFGTVLFSRAAPEDLLVYDADELAQLAREAFAFLAVRKPGTPKVRFVSPASQSQRLKSISVIEVVNDNMPFLVDSVMGELNDRGLSVRLVAHPIFAVQRDHDGRLTAPPAEGAAKNGALHESFIHVHVDRVGDEQKRDEVVRAIEQVLAEVRLCVADWRP